MTSNRRRGIGVALVLAGLASACLPFGWTSWAVLRAVSQADAAARATFLARTISEALNALSLVALLLGVLLAVAGAVLLHRHPRRRDPRGSLGPPLPPPSPHRDADASLPPRD
jgi:hypothetical protein